MNCITALLAAHGIAVGIHYAVVAYSYDDDGEKEEPWSGDDVRRQIRPSRNPNPNTNLPSILTHIGQEMTLEG